MEALNVYYYYFFLAWKAFYRFLSDGSPFHSISCVSCNNFLKQRCSDIKGYYAWYTCTCIICRRNTVRLWFPLLSHDAILWRSYGFRMTELFNIQLTGTWEIVVDLPCGCLMTVFRPKNRANFAAKVDMSRKCYATIRFHDFVGRSCDSPIKLGDFFKIMFIRQS